MNWVFSTIAVFQKWGIFTNKRLNRQLIVVWELMLMRRLQFLKGEIKRIEKQRTFRFKMGQKHWLYVCECAYVVIHFSHPSCYKHHNGCALSMPNTNYHRDGWKQLIPVCKWQACGGSSALCFRKALPIFTRKYHRNATQGANYVTTCQKHRQLKKCTVLMMMAQFQPKNCRL